MDRGQLARRAAGGSDKQTNISHRHHATTFSPLFFSLHRRLSPFSTSPPLSLSRSSDAALFVCLSTSGAATLLRRKSTLPSPPPPAFVSRLFATRRCCCFARPMTNTRKHESPDDAISVSLASPPKVAGASRSFGGLRSVAFPLTQFSRPLPASRLATFR